MLEPLELRSLLATGFPVGFVGPLPTDGYYDPSMRPAETSPAASPAGAQPGFGPIPNGSFYSNYDAPTLAEVVNSGPSATTDPYGTVSYSTDTGQFDELVGTAEGVQSNLTTSVTIQGDSSTVADQLGEVLLVIPPNYAGNITITETRSDPQPGSRTITVPITRYDDGAYKATLQSLKTLVSGSAASAASPPPPTLSPTAAQTGIRQGIDWSTLRFLRRDGAAGKDAGTGREYISTGNVWTVKTVLGSTIPVFEADPLAQQTQASRDPPTYEEPTYNCNAYSFGATGVVCPDGVTRSFLIINSADVKLLLSEAYSQVTVQQAFDLKQAPDNTKNLFFVFYENGEAVHSAVNTPSQFFSAYQSLKPPRDFNLGGQTVANSKNGDQFYTPDTTIKMLEQIFPGCNIKIYVLK